MSFISESHIFEHYIISRFLTSNYDVSAWKSMLGKTLGDDNVVLIKPQDVKLAEEEGLVMYRKPEKTYPTVRVRLVPDKSIGMIDVSMPSETLTEEELDEFKCVMFQLLDVAKALGNKAMSNNDSKVQNSQEEDQEVDKDQLKFDFGNEDPSDENEEV